MKRTIFLLFVLLFACLALTACECKHDEGEISTITKEATCTEAGTETFTCVKCNEVTRTEIIPFKGHGYIRTITKEATCTENGEILESCSVCGFSKTTTSAKTAHSFVTKSTAATCTKDGETSRTCSVCGHTASTTLTATGHNWVKGVCTKCKESKIKLPKTPKAFSYYNSKGEESTVFLINSVTISDVKYYTNGEAWYYFSVEGACTYNQYGSGQSSEMRLSYKLYDSKGYVIKSGTAYSESVAMGEKFILEFFILDLDANEEYVLKFLSTNNAD